MSKKVLISLFVFFLLPYFVLSGCKSTAEPPKLTSDFSADFNASYRDMNIKGSLDTRRQGLTNISIDYPESLKGLEIKYRNSEINISLDGLECSADEAYIPSEGFAQVVRSILKSAAQADDSLNESGEITVSTPYGNCNITADEDGIIKTAEINEINFSIEMVSAAVYQH